MNELEEFYEKLNKSNYDCRSEHQINSELHQISTQLLEKGESDILKYSELERLAFAIRKSFDTSLDVEKGTINGLSWQRAGTQTFEDGSEKPLYWPDVQSLSNEDFAYFEKRYKECENLYSKVEFGLLVYFGNKSTFSKHKDFKKSLFYDSLDLSKYYLSQTTIHKDKIHYVVSFISTIKTAFKLAEKSKLTVELKLVIDYIYSTHQNWNIVNNGTLRILLDLSDLMSEYFKVFKDKIDFVKVLDKNTLGAKELEKSYDWGAIYVMDRNIAICQKLESKDDIYIRYKAELYEKISIDSEENGNMACISSSEKALRLYQQLDDKLKISELEKRYSDQRGKFALGKIKQELPEEYTKQILKNILKTVSESNEIRILHHFINTPWYDKIENIEKSAEEGKKVSVLGSMLATSIIDKFGNTIDKFHTEEERNKFNFWQSYGFNFQIGTQTMHQFFIEAFKANKINFESVMSYLEGTWYNEIIYRKYHGEIVEVRPIDVIKPGIKRFFEEINSFFADETYRLDYVTVTDSLVLKIESIIRYFCEKIHIATFKTRQKGSDKLVMEKLLDDLLVDIKHSETNSTGFDEEDRIFIKYVLTEKAGLNLRNEVAHGLMDIYEYNFANVLVVFSIILKLSKYEFAIIEE
jgi:hypothetical protein